MRAGGKEGLTLQNLHINHIVIQSQLKYFIGAKIVSLKCRIFDDKTGQFRMVLVVQFVRPVATVRFRVELDPEPAQQFGSVINTRYSRHILRDSNNLIHLQSYN
jgi:hypothetical protein